MTYATFICLIGTQVGVRDHIELQLVCRGDALIDALEKVGGTGREFSGLDADAGFTGLCCCEGGLNGHAIAWLVTVPLCALLLAGRKSAQWWAVISFSAASVIAGIDLAGIKLPVTYAPEWHSVVSSAGYLGLILFLFILGLIFEVGGRARLPTCRMRWRNWRLPTGGWCI